MAELITLEGKAQEKGNKVTGYKFPDNLDELKFPFKMLVHPNYKVELREDLNSFDVYGVKKYRTIPNTSKEFIFVKKNGDELYTKEGYYVVVSKGVFDRNRVVISPEKISVDSNTSTSSNNTSSKIVADKPIEVKKNKSTSNAKLEQDLNNSVFGKTARKVQIGFSVVGWGVFGILAYKFWNKSSTWKLMLSVFGAYNLYSTYKTFKKPALQVSGGSNSNSNSNTGTSTSTSTNTNNQYGTRPAVGTIPAVGDLTKSQKIDLIIKNQNTDDEETDNNSKLFFNTLNDAELNIWIDLSRALKDSELSKAGESGDKQKLYSLLKSKYGLNQKDVDEQMKKMGEFLMGSAEKIMNNSPFTGNNSSFSNFESSLELDL